MAVLTRTTQTAEYVCVHDPDAVRPDPLPAVWPGPDPDWLPAAGQPATATRFRVRPLSPAEYDAARQAILDGDAEASDRACLAGLVAVDGEAPALSEMAFGWHKTLANLITGVSMLPMHGLLSRSRGGPSTDSTAGG